MKVPIVVSGWVIILAMILGCTKSGAPSCGDESVKKLVMDISKTEMQSQLLREILLKEFGMPPQMLSNYTYEDVVKDKEGEIEIKTYLAQQKVKKSQLLAKVDKFLTKAQLSLANLRITAKHDELQKSECAGELALADNSGNSQSFPITYTAQLTEDGKVYVTVSGLR